MHGTPNSLETIAACEVIPPSSVIIAADFSIATTKSGLVIFVTRTSPFSILFISFGSRITFTIPVATPGEAP